MRKKPTSASAALALAMLVLCLCPAEAARSQQRWPEPPQPVEGETQYFSAFRGWANDAYPLDGIERISDRRFRCESAGLVRYTGTHLRISPAARVHPAFVTRLSRFEEEMIKLGRMYYGRAPRVLKHRGTFNCRLARGRHARISEHAFGNAIDLSAVEFAALPRQEWREDQPRWLRRRFEVSVRQHWRPRSRESAQQVLHARFLHAIAEAARTTPGIFRGIVGPPRPRHADHLHLDVSPWRYALFSYPTL